MTAGAVVNFLKALMESSIAPRDSWLERFNEISPGGQRRATRTKTDPGTASSLPRQS